MNSSASLLIVPQNNSIFVFPSGTASFGFSVFLVGGWDEGGGGGVEGGVKLS